MIMTALLCACGTNEARQSSGEQTTEAAGNATARANTPTEPFTQDTTVGEVIHDPAFGDFGRLLFPVDRYISEDMTLADISSSDVYVWYSNIDADKTVEIVNDLKTRAENGERVFCNIYSDDEIEEDASRADTGVFFFKGDPGAKFAIMNAGGGFMYVGAMHDSFPHALEVSKKGYNAFALIYRPDYAYEDLAQAIAYIYDHAEELQVDKEGYSPREPEWRRSLATPATVLPITADRIFRRQLRSSCSTPATATLPRRMRRLMPVWEPMTGLPAGEPCSAVLRRWKAMESRQNSMFIMD